MPLAALAGVPRCRPATGVGRVRPAGPRPSRPLTGRRAAAGPEVLPPRASSCRRPWPSACSSSSFSGSSSPSFEDRLLERKRDTIRELTNVAFGHPGRIRRRRPGRAACRSTRRSGPRPSGSRTSATATRARTTSGSPTSHVRMIMHPYRTDLNGQDVSDFQDPRGVRIFVEFANVLRDRDDAYVEYVWQWKDDPDRLEPKQSYIKKFAPWGWILGTGLYIEDVQREIRAMAGRLVRVSVGITVLCALLLLFVAAQSMRIERRAGQGRGRAPRIPREVPDARRDRRPKGR
ncbi:MAG: cache domain-containing protein [Comamonadaceae bacterium]|nr:cache domain-containing protein [Comamonadaceae bacterium]